MDFSLGKKSVVRCYCAFCKNERKVYNKRHISLENIFLSAFLSFLLSVGIWQNFNPKVLIFFVIILIFNEVLIKLRWRINIVCRYCGFDPVLYLNNPEKAALKVNSYLIKQKDSVDYFFSDKMKFLRKYKFTKENKINISV